MLSIYNGPQGLVRGKDGTPSPEPVLGDSGHLRTCHLRCVIYSGDLQRYI